MPLRSLAAARGCRAVMEGGNDNAYSFAEWRTGVDVPLLPSGTGLTRMTQ